MTLDLTSFMLGIACTFLIAACILGVVFTIINDSEDSHPDKYELPEAKQPSTQTPKHHDE